MVSPPRAVRRTNCRLPAVDLAQRLRCRLLLSGAGSAWDYNLLLPIRRFAYCSRPMSPLPVRSLPVRCCRSTSDGTTTPWKLPSSSKPARGRNDGWPVRLVILETDVPALRTVPVVIDESPPVCPCLRRLSVQSPAVRLIFTPAPG